MSVSCDTGTAAVEFEGAACRLEAIFLYGLHTFVHLWALAHFVPFWSHPTHATRGYHQWCGCPQPLAPLVSPGGGLGPRFCATCASASGDFPPWQSRRTLTRFSTSLQNNTCGRSKDVSTEVCPTEAHCGRCPWLCYGSGGAPSQPRRTMRNTKRIHTCLQNCPTMFCTPTPNLFLLLDAASHHQRFLRLPNKGDEIKAGPKEGGNATSPLPSWGSPAKKTKSIRAQKGAEMLHHP